MAGEFTVESSAVLGLGLGLGEETLDSALATAGGEDTAGGDTAGTADAAGTADGAGVETAGKGEEIRWELRNRVAKNPELSSRSSEVFREVEEDF